MLPAEDARETSPSAPPAPPRVDRSTSEDPSWGKPASVRLLGGLVGADQPVYTATGPVPASELAQSDQGFVTIIYDATLGRFAARKAFVIEAGTGPLVSVTANGDHFVLAPEATVSLAHGGAAPVRALRPGNRLLACTMNDHMGYVRVNLRNGKKGRMHLHRMVALDVMGADPRCIIHHEDHDKLNNDPSNLKPLSSHADHARLHGLKLAATGRHLFQLNRYPKPGKLNPMHRDSAFWSDKKRSAAYREKKRREMVDRDPVALQRLSIRRQALNAGHAVRNAGHTFTTDVEYIRAHESVLGRIGNRRKKIESLTRLFGSIEGFNAALDAENHRVEVVGHAFVGPRYAVVVSTGGGDPIHTAPVVLWPVGATSPFGSGIVLHT